MSSLGFIRLLIYSGRLYYTFMHIQQQFPPDFTVRGADRPGSAMSTAGLALLPVIPTISSSS